MGIRVFGHPPSRRSDEPDLNLMQWCPFGIITTLRISKICQNVTKEEKINHI